MVGWVAVASPGMATGPPATLLATRTAIAPAVWALRILVEKLHTPREMSAICPARLPEGGAEQAVLNPFVLPATAFSGAVRSAATTAKSPITAPQVWPEAVTAPPMKCGT